MSGRSEVSQAAKVPGLEKRLADAEKYKDGARVAKAAEKKAAALAEELKQLKIDTADQKAELGHLKTLERERQRGKKEKADRPLHAIARPPVVAPEQPGVIEFVAGKEGEQWAWYQKPLAAAERPRGSTSAAGPVARRAPAPEGLRIQIQAEEWKPNLGTTEITLQLRDSLPDAVAHIRAVAQSAGLMEGESRIRAIYDAEGNTVVGGSPEKDALARQSFREGQVYIVSKDAWSKTKRDAIATKAKQLAAMQERKKRLADAAQGQPGS